MLQQREIARRAGVAQSTVSMALRNHPALSAATRERIHRIAEEMRYRPNAVVSSLMAHIRSGWPIRDQGCLAIVVAKKSMQEWLEWETYRSFYEGIQRRAERWGYQTECFFMENGLSEEQLDRILYSRGLAGVLLAPPQNRKIPPLMLRWERYACATISYTYRGPDMHRVASHYLHNVELALRHLIDRGYRRPGLCVPEEVLRNFDSGWVSGFVHSQWKHFTQRPIPLFIEVPGQLTHLKRFEAWRSAFRPDVIVCLTGEEKGWLDTIGIRVPDDMGMVCLNRPPGSPFSGVEENHAMIGEGAIDLLVAQIQANERGVPTHPKHLLYDGLWVDGETLRKPNSVIPV
ncbi:MAG TPA: LacI family DNA-binding transcriptional regulator [Candidatus Methylacidiphilales bacterium]